MRIATRLGIFASLASILVACGGFSQTASTLATGAQAAGSHANVNGRLVVETMHVAPKPGAPPILMNFIADGPNQGGVPCVDCVNGASSSDNIGMTGPSSYVPSNTYWQYAISFTDVSYTGKCKVSWAIVSPSKKTIDSFSASFDLTSAGGFVIYAIARARPSYSGPATVTGKYACGKNTASTQEPLYFE